jgi:hypothetical protein
MAAAVPEPVPFEKLIPEHTYFHFSPREQRGFFVQLQDKRVVPQISIKLLDEGNDGIPEPIMWQDFERRDDMKFYKISDYKRLRELYPHIHGWPGRRPKLHKSYRNLVARNLKWNRVAPAVAAWEVAHRPLPENVFENAAATGGTRRRTRKHRKTRRHRR